MPDSQEPTSLLLHGKLNWPTQVRSDVSVGQGGLQLKANNQGLLSLTSADGSMGGIKLPRGIALDAQNKVYLLDSAAPWQIKYFDSETKTFVPLPSIGGEGTEARQFKEPSTIAIVDGFLYVADTGSHRVQVFALGDLSLHHLWDKSSPALTDWLPKDITTHAGQAYILDSHHGYVYRHIPGTDGLEQILTPTNSKNTYQKIAVDLKGNIYLLNGNNDEPEVDIYSLNSDKVGNTKNAGDIRDLFAPPAIRFFSNKNQNYFCLPESLTSDCPQVPQAPPSPENPLAACLNKSGVAFDANGKAVKLSPADLISPRLYISQGTWLSKALDSKIYNCQWHRIELKLKLPPGSQLKVSTYTSNEQSIGPSGVAGLPWELSYLATGEMQPSNNTNDNSNNKDNPAHEFLIQNREGQYLWLKLELTGDGRSSPIVESIRIHFPRISYLEYLPAIYSADDESRLFLGRFLSIFQAEWDKIEDQVANIAAYFDPCAAPEEFLDTLAAWFHVPLEQSWSAKQKRTLLKALGELFATRGTPRGLKRYLQVFIENFTGLPAEEQGDYPMLIESFREREYTRLSQSVIAQSTTPLWSASVTARLQSDVFAQADEVRLVSTGDPARDIFHEFAHKFRVFVPAAWVSSEEQENMLKRALNAEKPAQTSFELHLVEPNFTVGMQARLGLDTILGGYPPVRLGDKETSGASISKLGYNTFLASEAMKDRSHSKLKMRVGKGMALA